VVNSDAIRTLVERDRNRMKGRRRWEIVLPITFGMSDCKPVGTPMLPESKLSSDQSPQNADEKAEMINVPYINAVGSLMYLATMTHPDIAYTVGVLARFNSSPGQQHLESCQTFVSLFKGNH
jgi:hypothetical protein